MKGGLGSIRTGIQGQSGGEDAAAGERDATLDLVAREVGIGAGTLGRWREDAQSRPARGRAWTPLARLEAVITTAALGETGKSAWCREHGVYPSELDKWRASCTAALSAPEESRASPQATRQDRKRIKELERDLLHKDRGSCQASCRMRLSNQAAFRSDSDSLVCGLSGLR